MSFTFTPAPVVSTAVTTYVRLNGTVMSGTYAIGTPFKEMFDGTVAGGAGHISAFLTSDGLTKTGSNTLLYATILSVNVCKFTVVGVDTAPFLLDGDYTVGTGAIRAQCGESKNTGVLIGGNVDGLETCPNGRTARVIVEGII